MSPSFPPHAPTVHPSARHPHPHPHPLQLKPFITDTVDYLNVAHESGKRILIEGANATMLDLDFGTYPFVTSSNPSIGGIATGLGLAPNKYEALIGVVGAVRVRVYVCGRRRGMRTVHVL